MDEFVSRDYLSVRNVYYVVLKKCYTYSKKNFFLLTSFSLLFSELSLVGFALDVVD